MIEDTQRQLREARERLQASSEALAEAANASAVAEAPAVTEREADTENYWLPAATASAAEPRERYIPESAPAWVQRRLRRAPVWARPSVVGAGIVAMFAGAAMLAASPYLVGHPREIIEAGRVFLAAIAAGVLGGLGFALTRKATEPLGRLGDCLTGIASVAGYMAPLPFLRRPGESLVGMLVSGVICSIVFGVLIGLIWFGRDRDSFTSPIRGQIP